jgi:antitoxin component YwqK of YwqJK toxin-antitoxin module
MKETVRNYENGILKEKGFETKKGKQGKWQFFNANGSLFIEAEYKGHEEHGSFVR